MNLLNNINITKNFKLTEFQCPCCKGVFYNRELAEGLEELRNKLSEHYGKEVSIKIESGYRCPKHNKAIGGAHQSQHLTGKAADLICRIKETNELVPTYISLKFIMQINKFKGIGYGPTKIHVDTRPKYTFWIY